MPFRPLLPAWEIFRYNVLEPHGGPELYGVEPASFYAVNSLLNFNGAAPLAALTPAVLAVAAVCVGKFRVLSKQLKYLAALYIWFLFFSSLPHKEERFLCPVYPLICLAAAATLRVLAVGGEGLLARCGASRDFASALMSLSWKVAVALIGVVGAARGAALFLNYAAPLQIYAGLSASLAALPPAAPPAVVCVGKEWYRFPSSFFLPDEKFSLAFLHDGPASQLPQPYSREHGTSVAPPNFNDQNREEPSRYVSPDTCDYVVELLLERGDPPEHGLDLLDESAWEVVASAPYLDTARSALPWRAFHVPSVSPAKNAFAQYVAARCVPSVATLAARARLALGQSCGGCEQAPR